MFTKLDIKMLGIVGENEAMRAQSYYQPVDCSFSVKQDSVKQDGVEEEVRLQAQLERAAPPTQSRQLL